MAIKKLTSREFNQNTSGAKKAAEKGPVYITSRGRPSHVLLSFADYRRLSGNQPGLIERLGEPAGVEDAQLQHVPSRDRAEPAGFE